MGLKFTATAEKDLPSLVRMDKADVINRMHLDQVSALVVSPAVARL